MVERMERYIEKTQTLASAKACYDMTGEEIKALCSMEDRGRAILLAFNFGRAKERRATLATLHDKDKRPALLKNERAQA